MQYMMEHGKTSVSPTPRKKSMDMIEEKMNQIFFNNKSVGFIGISGGQASGKTKIANYFHKNIKNSAIISEIAISTASPLMEILPFPDNSQCRYPPRFEA